MSKYNLKKAIVNASCVFIGVIIANITDGKVVFESIFWKHTLFVGVQVTVYAELRYIYAWLNSLNGNGNGNGKT